MFMFFSPFSPFSSVCGVSHYVVADARKTTVVVEAAAFGMAEVAAEVVDVVEMEEGVAVEVEMEEVAVKVNIRQDF